MKRTPEGLPLNSSNIPVRYHAIRVESFDPRPDGLVYSSDGHHVQIQTGIDSGLEAIADAQHENETWSDADAEDLRSETDQIVMVRRLNREVSIMQIDDIIRDSGF